MKTWGKSESVEENVREKYLSIQIVFSNFAGCMEKTSILITAEMKKRRKEIKEEAKTLLVGQVLSHPYFPHDIYINMSGIKEWLNQPHRHYSEKNEALLRLPELLNDAEYIDAVPDPKGRDYIMASHLFKTIIADSDSWIIINESIWGEYLVHSISDNIPYVNKEQDL